MFYIINWITHMFWLVLFHNLLGDRHINVVIINKFCFVIIENKQNSMLLWVCTVGDHRKHKNVPRKSRNHLAFPHMPPFCSHRILTSSVIYDWTDTWKPARVVTMGSTWYNFTREDRRFSILRGDHGGQYNYTKSIKILENKLSPKNGILQLSANASPPPFENTFVHS